MAAARHPHVAKAFDIFAMPTRRNAAVGTCGVNRDRLSRNDAVRRGQIVGAPSDPVLRRSSWRMFAHARPSPTLTQLARSRCADCKVTRPAGRLNRACAPTTVERKPVAFAAWTDASPRERSHSRGRCPSSEDDARSTRCATAFEHVEIGPRPQLGTLFRRYARSGALLCGRDLRRARRLLPALRGSRLCVEYQTACPCLRSPNRALSNLASLITRSIRASIRAIVGRRAASAPAVPRYEISEC